MNERGFFTLIGICFLIVASLLVRSLQESAENYFDITKDFQTEIELQNAADSALLEAVKKIKDNPEKFVKQFNFDVQPYQNQYEIPLQTEYDADVKVIAEYGKCTKTEPVYNKETNQIENQTLKIKMFHFMEKKYPSENIVDRDKPNEAGIILISVASRESKFGKVYRRSLAYVLEGNDGKLDDTKIYFMNDL